MTKNSERKVPPTREALYHWAPRSRRAGIVRYGLCPGQLSLDRDWRPPHVCLSDDPLLAWYLSGRLHPEIDEWDLWMVFTERVGKAEAILELYRDRSGHYVKEWRVYHRIYKRDLHYLATRKGMMDARQTNPR